MFPYPTAKATRYLGLFAKSYSHNKAIHHSCKKIHCRDRIGRNWGKENHNDITTLHKRKHEYGNVMIDKAYSTFWYTAFTFLLMVYIF
jgi:hypothetical protein